MPVAPEQNAGVGPDRRLLAVVCCLLILYLVWGSTFFAIRVCVEAMPPFLMCVLRYVAAGAILAGAAAVARLPMPTVRQLGGAAVLGLLSVVGINAPVVWAEQFVASGLVALLVGMVPIFVLVFELFGGRRMTGAGLAAACLGFGGVSILFGRSPTGAGGGIDLLAIGLVVGGCAANAGGIILGRHLAVPQSFLYLSGFSQLAAALTFGVLAVGAGEPARMRWGAIGVEAWAALGFLIVFGSCVAFSAYFWLIRNAEPRLVATYAFVNPLVAVALGALAANEPLSPALLAGGTAIVAAIGLTLLDRKP